MEQYTRMEDMIVNGLNTRHCSYARAAAGASGNNSKDDTPGEIHSLEQQVLKFFASKDIDIDSRDISACHALPRKDKAKSAIVVLFVKRKTKNN